MTACEVYGPFHTFDVPTGDDGYGRRCACGTPQVYRRPTGEASKFSDVLVAAEDLRQLVAVAEFVLVFDGYDPRGEIQEIVDRVQMLLD